MSTQSPIEMSQIILIDDDEDILHATHQTLVLNGFDVIALQKSTEALSHISPDFYGVVVSDIRMPALDGMALLEKISAIDADIPVILLTGHGDIDLAVRALKSGAYDFMTKPYPSERLSHAIKQALNQRQLVLENRALKRSYQTCKPSFSMVGHSANIEQLRAKIENTAKSDMDVLIMGETGTGKTLLARCLHEASKRARRPLVVVDCGSLMPQYAGVELFGCVNGAFDNMKFARSGAIERANQSTLLLHGIENLSMDAQQKLLVFLDNGGVRPIGGNDLIPSDVRLIVTSREDLTDAGRENSLITPLLYRINNITLKLSPLRDRPEDIPLLFRHFMQLAAQEAEVDVPDISPEIWHYLHHHPWPGNVRELKNFAQKIVLGLGISDLFSAETRPENSSSAGLKEQVADFEAAMIRQALANSGGSVKDAIDHLQIPRKTFYDKVQKHHIDISSFRQ